MSESIIELDEDQDLRLYKVSIGGKVIECDLSKVLEELEAIDRQVDAKYGRTEADRSEPLPDNSWLDLVVEMLKANYGLERCSRNAAAGFYNLALTQVDSIKKKHEKTPESPSGTGSIQEASDSSPTQADESWELPPGLGGGDEALQTTSPDSTPSAS